MAEPPTKFAEANALLLVADDEPESIRLVQGMTRRERQDLYNACQMLMSVIRQVERSRAEDDLPNLDLPL